MLWEVLKLSNQYNCIDNNCLLIGRRGVGKRYTFNVSVSINKEQASESLSDSIIMIIKGEKVIHYEEYQKDKILNYQKLQDCESDNDLEPLIDIKEQDTYREALSGTDGKDSTRLLEKVRGNIRFVIAMDNKTAFNKLTNKFRCLSHWPVVQLHQWPKEALIGIANPEDPRNDIHASVFVKANQILLDKENTSMPIMKYQKYLALYAQLIAFNKKEL